jgi:hypothetical protein
MGDSNGGLEKTAQFRASFCVILNKYYPSDQIKTNEIDGACETYGERTDVEFRCGILRERNHLKDIGVDRRILLKWKLKK